MSITIAADEEEFDSKFSKITAITAPTQSQDFIIEKLVNANVSQIAIVLLH
jgi:hypothetical protein